MSISFYKYQGTGNDFVMIDNRQNIFSKNDTKLVQKLCDRKFGIGADGLILLENHPEVDFTMVYYNADGQPSSMCGNGGRCIVAFAKALQIIEDKTTFEAVDGLHKAFIDEDNIVHLKMQDVNEVISKESHLFLDTGSPHHVELVDNLKDYDVVGRGAGIRYSGNYGDAGANVNFVEVDDTTFSVRTYERGVEDETLSCGTGVTAVALAMHTLGKTQANDVNLQVEGGRLKVTFKKTDTGYENIYLVGPAEQVYTGVWPQ